MDLFAERCAGIDIGKADLKACVRTPGPPWPAERDSHVRHDDRKCSRAPGWLIDRQVTLVGMESTRCVLEADLLPT